MPLFGREVECARIDALLERARAGQSAVLFVRGEPGIGKTALLGYTLSRAGPMRSLTARGVESEMALPFAGLAELVGPIVDKLDRLPAPQAAALSGALAIGPPSGNRFAIAAATLGLLAAAAEEAPLLVAVDDVQWLDEASTEAIAFAARRLEAEGIAVVLAARTEESSPFDAAELPELILHGIDDPAAREVVASTGVSITSADVTRIVQAAHGNPLALLELPTAIAGGASSHIAFGPLPVGPNIERLFASRLEALAPPTQRALVVAAADGSGNVGTVLAAMGALGIDERALGPAEVAKLITIWGKQLEWRHPLLRSIAYHAAPFAERRAAHAALAAAPGVERDVAAWHLAAAAAAPDAGAADGLEKVADSARGRHALSAAALAYERAAELSVDDEARSRRLYEAAHVLEVAGRGDDALRIVDLALPITADPLRRADLEHVRGRIEMFRGHPARARASMLEAAGRVEALDPDRATRLLADAAVTSAMAGDVGRAYAIGERALAISAGGTDSSRMVARALMAQTLIIMGRSQTDPRAREYLAQLRAIADHGDPLVALALIPTAGYGSVLLEDYEGALRLYERAIGAGREAGAIGLLTFPLGALSDLYFRMGRWLAAYAAAGEACRLAIEMSQTNLLAFDLHFLARVEAGLGLVDACRANAREALRLAAGFGSESIETYVHAVLGQLELSLGQVDESIQHLERAAELARRHGLGEPSVVQWAPDLVEAYVRSGQTERATRTLASFQLQANDTGRRGALAAAARCRGLLDEDDYEGAFAAAMAWHNETDTPFERARTELALGERRRRARRRAEARQPLRSALATFERLGAAVWVNRARQELRAAGAEPPAVRSSPSALLTAQELQIALHVSEGRTNQEVGAALFLSPKTVEHHLGRAYRKLKVRSRTELARVLGQDRQEPPRDRQ